jgi:hypothetical protein
MRTFGICAHFSHIRLSSSALLIIYPISNSTLYTMQSTVQNNVLHDHMHGLLAIALEQLQQLLKL